jgi:hypothetical protein
MIKVRATKDGTYGGYFRNGPIDSDQGYQPGEVFELDEKPFVIKDTQGNPVQEMEPTGQLDANGGKIMKPVWEMENGKVKKDANGRPVPKLKMATWFSSEWMERVGDDTDVTYDYPPFEVPAPYRIKKQKTDKAVVVLPNPTMTENSGLESPI